MEFYESISNNYDHIFPPNPGQVKFIMHFTDQYSSPTKLLDVGCATGSLALALAEKNVSVWAFDYNAEMVKLAHIKMQRPELTKYPVFEQLDMRIIDQHYQLASFNLLACFGNTLVHLLTDKEILQFLMAAHAVLQKDGKILIQILNYDYIFSEKIKSLPLIDNEHIRFERFYNYPDDATYLDFKTKLTIKSSGKQIINCVRLNPVTKNKMEQVLIKARFQNIQFFGDFNCGPLQSNSLPLIVSAVK